MLTQIEFYDKDTIKNILAVLTLEPDRVVYIYDDAIKDKKYFDALNKCFKKHIPQIRVEAVAVNNNSVSDIYEKTISIINSDKDCMMELTGGSELMMIAGHKAGSERKIQMLYTDIAAGTITDIENPEWVKETAVLTLDDFIDAKGAAYAGGMHNEPEERYNRPFETKGRFLLFASFQNQKCRAKLERYPNLAGSLSNHKRSVWSAVSCRNTGTCISIALDSHLSAASAVSSLAVGLQKIESRLLLFQCAAVVFFRLHPCGCNHRADR